MNKIQTYSQLLQVRTTLKKLQQLSWMISKLEQRYDLDNLNDFELEELLRTYQSFLPQINLISDELKDANENNLP